VSIYSLCDDVLGLGSASQFEECDDDGLCEEEYGETVDNCDDCDSTKTGTNKKISGRKDLFILDLKSTMDKWNKNATAHPFEDYQEGHLQGKYEITCSYAIIDMTNSTSRATPLKNVGSDDAHEPNTGRRDIKNLWSATAWGNNCDIKRRKTMGNGIIKTNRGIEDNLKSGIDRLLFLNYNPLNQNIYLIFVESDGSFGYKNHSIHDIDANIPDNSNTKLQEEGHQKAWTFDNIGGTDTEIFTIEAPGVSPTSNGWTAVTMTVDGIANRTGFKKTFTLDNEMHITMGFFD
jgi:hypothetical protein